MADFWPERADFWPERADFRPERSDFRTERVYFRPEWANTPDKIRRTGNICLRESNIGPGFTRFGIEIAKIFYFDVVEQQSEVV